MLSLGWRHKRFSQKKGEKAEGKGSRWGWVTYTCLSRSTFHYAPVCFLPQESDLVRTWMVSLPSGPWLGLVNGEPLRKIGWMEESEVMVSIALAHSVRSFGMAVSLPLSRGPPLHNFPLLSVSGTLFFPYSFWPRHSKNYSSWVTTPSHLFPLYTTHTL